MHTHSRLKLCLPATKCRFRKDNNCHHICVNPYGHTVVWTLMVTQSSQAFSGHTVITSIFSSANSKYLVSISNWHFKHEWKHILAKQKLEEQNFNISRTHMKDSDIFMQSILCHVLPSLIMMILWFWAHPHGLENSSLVSLATTIINHKQPLTIITTIHHLIRAVRVVMYLT